MSNIKYRILFSALIMISGLFGADACIIPKPSEIVCKEGTLKIGRVIGVRAEDHELKRMIHIFSKELKTVSDGYISACFSGDKPMMSVRISSEMAQEEYELIISDNGINVTGGSSSGCWWGMQTLVQIIGMANKHDGLVSLPCVHIEDAPEFSYRGVMLDCSRHFFSVDEIKKFIDILSFHKINRFHWHLTDDQGWRIQIRKYPKLTSVGSVREETVIGHLHAPEGYDGIEYKGYYTQRQIRDIIEYAKDRAIEIVPEIEMPGHAMAALASYPNLGCKGEGYEVWTDWGICKETFCIGNPEVLVFLKDVLDEICQLFPGEYVHIGGDEVLTERWKECPKCQNLMKELGITDEKELQYYFLRQIEDYLKAKGKRIIGWDDILDSGVTETATVMSWRGVKGGIAAARKGNEAIMSPNTYYYFDYYQTEDPVINGEPLANRKISTLENCYSFEPALGLRPEEIDKIIGIQANIWTEYIADFEHLQCMILPRLSAMAEVAWSSDKSDYDDFYGRLVRNVLPLYSLFEYKYAWYAL